MFRQATERRILKAWLWLIGVEYTKIEKYLGHYITDDNSLNASIIYDLEERASNVIVKYRNFINNNKSATIHLD